MSHNPYPPSMPTSTFLPVAPAGAASSGVPASTPNSLHSTSVPARPVLAGTGVPGAFLVGLGLLAVLVGVVLVLAARRWFR